MASFTACSGVGDLHIFCNKQKASLGGDWGGSVSQSREGLLVSEVSEQTWKQMGLCLASKQPVGRYGSQSIRTA